MRRDRSPTIAAMALAAMAAAGCGEDPGVEQGLVPFKGTDTSSFAPLRNDMMKKMQDQSYLKRSGPDGEPAVRPASARPQTAGGPESGATPAPPAKGS